MADENAPAHGEPQTDASYDGFRITSVWTVVGVDPADNQEGVCAVVTNAGLTPLVATDERRVDVLLRPAAAQLATRTGRRIELVRFDARESVEVFEPEAVPEALEDPGKPTTTDG